MVRGVGGDKVARTKADIKEALRAQTGFLAKSCKAYDAGDVDEVSRIAASLRVLLNTSQANSPSIIKQLDLVSSRFTDSGHRYQEPASGPQAGMIVIRLDNQGAVPLARCLVESGQLERRVVFSEWWNQHSVVTDDEKVKYTRMALVGYLANEDNGTHFDP